MSPHARTDRNLLFGILALQMDFIGRDALIAAMHAWVLDKAKPLGRILMEQQALSSEEHDLLQALVQKHIEKHSGDVQKSLAAVSSIGSVRQQLQQVEDAELHASLVHVSADRVEDFAPLPTRPPTAGTPTSSGTRFRILRPHAKGGLGHVFVAHDEELHREVALKEIQNDYADHQEYRNRFLLEAEITGGLEHPSIVPVYGLGKYADGRPFYAMRFIRGDSLHHAIARFHRADTPGRDGGERTLALRKLLGRFLDVCNAIAYAHSRGVLHRDLKPGNIMLGEYGETLVVDWGLAKPLGRTESASRTIEKPLRPSSASDSAPTQMGSAIGTPEYMSPEQAAGRLDELGPASDVYSLGATLYCLLTGTAPFQGTDIGAVLRQVQSGEFQRPREVKSAVPAALEAVCRKAMALRPEDRYASPRALAEDIEHWLADEPVSAWPDPWQVRTRRWVGRHRTLVTASAATLLVATVSLTVATILLQAANTRERQANDAKEAALQQAEDNAADARHQEELALQQKQQAETNEQEAKHQKEVAEKQKRETEEQAAIALAVNDFLQKDLLGQADFGQQRIGAREERDPDVKVRTLLDRAARSIEGKFKDQPATEAALRLTIGDAYRALGHFDESQRHLERSQLLATAKRGVDHPDTLRSKNSLALLYQAQGKYGLAELLFKEALQARTAKLGAEHSDTLGSKHCLAGLYRSKGKYVLAESLYKEVVQAYIAKLGADHPDTLAGKNDLAGLYQDQGKYGLAESLFNEVVRTSTAKLGAEHPHTLTGKSNLAGLYGAQGNYGLSESLYKEVLQAWTAKLGADHPHSLSTKHSLAALYYRQGKSGLAESLFKEVLQTRSTKLGAEHPDTLSTRGALAVLYEHRGKYDLAEPLYKEVLHRRTAKLGADHPDTLASKHDLAVMYQNQRKYDLAEPLLNEVLQARTAKLGADHPDSLDTKQSLAALLFERQAKYDLVEPLLNEVLQARTAKLGADHPDTLRTKHSLALLYHRQGKSGLAEPLLKEVMQSRSSKLGVEHPDTLGAKENLAGLYQTQGKYDFAESLYKEVLQTRSAKLGTEDPTTLKTADNLTMVYFLQRKYSLAESLFKKVLRAKSSRLGAEDPETLASKENLAALYRIQRKYDLAEPLYKEVLKMRSAKLGNDHPDTLLTMAGLGINYRDTGRTKDALLLLEEAWQRGRKCPGGLPAKLAAIPSVLATTYDRAELFDKSEPLYRTLLDEARTKHGDEDTRTAGQMALLSFNLLRQKKYADAESILRKCLVICDKKEPDLWPTFRMRSVLGEALAGQKKYAEAELLLLQGYEGMKQRERSISPQARVHLTEGLERLVQLYTAWGKKNKADEYRKKLEAERAKSSPKKK